MKLIAFYLPQFYEFEENNRWWGKGFTEWTNVKKAEPLFKNHYQPHVPYNDNYYVLDSVKVFKEQLQLAKDFGIYGFCFYHYWLGDGRLLMEKPIELFLNNKELDMPFCLSWANHNWTRTWIGGEHDILMEQTYGDECEWRAHYDYLFPFINDDRYIRCENKPILIIYQPHKIPMLDEMLNELNTWAMEDGLEGLCFISQESEYAINHIDEKNAISYCIQYEPNYTNAHNKPSDLITDIICNPPYVYNRISELLKHRIGEIFKLENWYLTKHNYDAYWKKILSYKNINKKMIPCAFTSFDNTPRRGRRGQVYHKSTPKKFEKYLTSLIRKGRYEYKKEFIFINAWNEWGEGAVLEPDTKYDFGYLKAVKNALMDCGEWENEI